MGIRGERDAGLFLLYPCKTFYHMTCISSSMPLKANGCHNHLKLKIKASSAILCFFRRYFQ